MATYAIQKGGLTGTALVYGAVTANDDFPNGGSVRLHVKNGGVGSINVTINSVKACDQGFDHDVVVAVGPGLDREIGPFDPARFVDQATGKTSVAYSGITTVTAAAIG